MTYKIKEILEKIKSSNKDVLDQSMKIIDEQSREELERAKSAITRVNALIALSGAVSFGNIYYFMWFNSRTWHPLLVFAILRK